MKTCTNPECKAKNPDHAEFCGECGTPFITRTSPPEEKIQWQETSLVKIHRTFGGHVVTFFVFIVWIVGGILLLLNLLHEYSDFHISEDFIWIVVLIFFFSLLIWLLRVGYGENKTEELHKNASAIEMTGEKYRRIMKGNKIGMYDWKKKKILLPVEYQSIERMGDVYYKIKKDGKYGIFSKLLNRIIVDCEYDDVSPFVNNIAELVQGNKKLKVDSQGNIF
jgi:hypothetical protein